MNYHALPAPLRSLAANVLAEGVGIGNALCGEIVATFVLVSGGGAELECMECICMLDESPVAGPTTWQPLALRAAWHACAPDQFARESSPMPVEGTVPRYMITS